MRLAQDIPGSAHMSLKFHGVMQDAPDDDVGDNRAIDNEMPWPSDNAFGAPRAISAVTEMPAANAIAELGAIDAAGSRGIGCYVVEPGEDQLLVAQPGRLAELRLRPDKDLDDVILGGFGKSVVRHQLRARSRSPARSPRRSMCSASPSWSRSRYLPARTSLQPTCAAFPQDLARVLVAARADQRLDDLMLMIGENDVAGGHSFAIPSRKRLERELWHNLPFV